MAKGNAMGLWTGKKGSSVFYKIWNSNNKEKQGIREYQPNVSNPQTNSQADQRMKMLSAQLVKGALRDIVSRSFQGVKYGAQSRLEFMKYALRADVFPFLPKGWIDPVPGEYVISRGTLPALNCYYFNPMPGFTTNLHFKIEITSTTTIGEVSSDLLSRNAQLMEGDQLTFVGCLLWPDRQVEFEWVYYSIELNTTDETTIRDTPKWERLAFAEDNNLLTLIGDADNLIAAGVILSRMGSDGQYLRSTCQLSLADEPEDFTSYFGSTSKQIARASYQKSTRSTETDWPVQREEGADYGVTIDGTYTLQGLTGELVSLNDLNVKVRVSEATGALRAVYVTESPLGGTALVAYNGDAVSYTVDGVVTYLQPSRVPALANLPQVTWNSNANRMAAPLAAPEAEPEAAPEATKKAKAKK